jgi:hypothetical protein
VRRLHGIGPQRDVKCTPFECVFIIPVTIEFMPAKSGFEYLFTRLDSELIVGPFRSNMIGTFHDAQMILHCFSYKERPTVHKFESLRHKEYECRFYRKQFVMQNLKGSGNGV